MNKLFVAVFLIALGVHGAAAVETSDGMRRTLSIAALRDLVTAPRIYKVAAYVVRKYDKCPPCPPNAVCETCELGIYVADDYGPGMSAVVMNDGMYLRTDDAGSFRVGSKYLLTIRYRVERNAAGAWLQTGPELIDFARIGAEDEENK